MAIEENVKCLISDIAARARRCGRDPADITLVAVTKQRDAGEILDAYEAGCRDMGESRVQEGEWKLPALPPDIRWHFIGTLQKNKVKKVVGNYVLIHSVDSPELAAVIDKESEKIGQTTSVLLEVNTSGEASKHGLTADEWKRHLDDIRAMPNLYVLGWMTMARETDDEAAVRNSFRSLRELRDATGLTHLSMGMSGDYGIAIEEGATLLRIGSAIFQGEG